MRYGRAFERRGIAGRERMVIIKRWLLGITIMLLGTALCACGADDTARKKKEAGWSARQGITVTPQGDCQVEMGGYDAASGELTGKFMADVNVSISESTDGVTDGFKKVSALFIIDASDCTGDGVLFWCSAFDRYTGTSFEFDSAVNEQLDGEHTAQDGFVTIRDGDEAYDISIEFMTDGGGYTFYKTIAVTCPIEYEGVMFQIGDSTIEQMAENSEIDYAARLYTIDELPYFGDEYLYFTLTDD